MGAAALRDVLRRHRITPTKALGQNFVIDPNTIRKVVGVAGLTPTDRVLEIGAGAGSLTLALAAVADHVVAVEKDPRLGSVLEEVVGYNERVEIVIEDASVAELSRFKANKLVANLPYNLAARLVLRALDEASGIGELTVMTQKEVGERLAARPGTTSYGAASVMVACYANARVAAPVSRNAFYPVPNVDSVVVRLERRPLVADPSALRPVVQAAFSQRRKTLRNALAPLAGSAAQADAALAEANVTPQTRAEELSVEAFAAIAGVLS